MIQKVSKKCGYGKCQFYDKDNQDSKCSKYSDRSECYLSIRKMKRVAKVSKLKDSRILKF